MNNQPEIDIKAIAASLRAIRKQQGLTLKEVEERSAGRWKAVVIGSYERCDRSLSLNKAISLAHFYQVPLDELLGLNSQKALGGATAGRTIIDMRALSALDFVDERTTLLKSFLGALCAKRRDWNGEVLSLRLSDLSVLGLLLTLHESDVQSWLVEKGLMLKAS
jgi:transcriptional regulator with XRE-family HTH domain